MTDAPPPDGLNELSPGAARQAARGRPSRRTLWLLLAPVIALSVLGLVADIFAAALVKDHPLVQIFLNPRVRYLALAANNTDPVPFFVVGFVRLVLLDPVYYLLGYFYGDTALRWIERKMGDTEGMLRMLERGFAKASYPMVMIAPNQFICVLAGAAGMRPIVFVTLNLVGTVLRLLLIEQVADFFSGPLDSLLNFITRYRWWLVGFSAVLFGFQFVMQRKQGKSDIESISKVQADFERAAHEVAADRAAGRPLPSDRLHTDEDDPG